jgi:NAD-dependent deacetylase
MTRNGSVLYTELARLISSSRRVLFITGAGVSADSGLPTYRGVGGLYNDEVTEEGLSIEEALSGDCFSVRPDITWKYLAKIQHNCSGVRPNEAHYTIARLENRLEVVVLTQNIDGLHRAAGSSNVIPIHGSLEERFCPSCDSPADARDPVIPPRCAVCDAIVRPRVVLFNEALPQPALQRLAEEQARGFDLVFVIGTSAVFQYVVEPVVQALRVGIPVVEINPAMTRLSPHVDYYIPEGAAAVMQGIQHALDT